MDQRSTISRTTSPTKAYAAQFLAYLLATIAAIGAARALGFQDFTSTILAFGLGTLAGTLVIFGFSLLFNNSSFYDPYWSLQPIVIGWALYVIAGHPLDARTGSLLLLVSLWGLRLTYNFLRGWKGLQHEDWRYVDFRQRMGRLYWLVSFSGIHLFPTVMVFLGCLPLFVAFLDLAPENPLYAYWWGAAIFTFVCIGIEALADEQLHAFVRRNQDAAAFLSSGLWGVCRHPNYLGEMGFWWGLYLFGLAANPAYWWTGIGALLISLMFVFISVPLIDKRMLKKRPAYQAYRKQKAALLPGLW